MRENTNFKGFDSSGRPVHSEPCRLGCLFQRGSGFFGQLALFEWLSQILICYKKLLNFLICSRFPPVVFWNSCSYFLQVHSWLQCGGLSMHDIYFLHKFIYMHCFHRHTGLWGAITPTVSSWAFEREQIHVIWAVQCQLSELVTS